MKTTFNWLSVIILFTFSAFYQRVSAQLPTISTDENEVWYYIENGHNANGMITNNDGRFCGLITSNGENVSADIDVLAPTNERGAQRWKLVAVPDEDGFYYLINQNGEYFYRASEVVFSDVRANYASTIATGDSAKYELFPQAGSQYYIIHRKGGEADEKLCALNGGNSWTFDETTGAVNAVNDNGLHSSPRSWRFVPIEEIDGFYPDISAQNTVTEDIINWYFIRSLDPEANDAPYITLKEDGSGFELQAPSIDIETQLFGFISNGKKTAAANTGGHLTHIVSKADQTKYLNPTMSGVAYDWYLEHVVAPKQNAIQGTIRTDRHMDFLIASGTDIATEAKNSDNNGNSATIDTYNSKYNWIYETVEPRIVAVSAGANITIVTTSPELNINNEADVPYDNSITITYTVDAGYAPIVTVDDSPVAIGTLISTDGSGNKTYEVVIPHITDDVSISIQVGNTVPVTVNATHVTIQSPSLDENNQYASPATSVIVFKLEEGYANPEITTGNTNYTLSNPVGGVYSLTLSGVSEPTTVTITASIKTYTVTVDASAGIELIYPANGNTVTLNHGENADIQFKLTGKYHSPRAIDYDNTLFPLVPGVDGVYTIPQTAVISNRTIAIGAFTAKQIPVYADTWVRGGAANENVNHAQDTIIRVEYSTYNPPTFLNRSYLQFDATSIAENVYDNVALQLTVAGLEKATGTNLEKDLYIEIRTVPEELPAIADMTWYANGELADPQGDAITDPIQVSPSLVVSGSILKIDIPGDYVLKHLDSPILLQINGEYNSVNDGWISFFSQEAVSLFAIPTLVFKNGNDSALNEVTDEDTVISKKYYTLQGLEVNTPVKGEIYILKRIYASAKASVVKVLIR
jgi:hypothetical protein